MYKESSSFTWRTHMTYHVVILMAKTYYIKRTQSKISKGKFRENQAHASKSPLPIESHRTCLTPKTMNWTAFVKCCLIYQGTSLEIQCRGIYLRAGNGQPFQNCPIDSVKFQLKIYIDFFIEFDGQILKFAQNIKRPRITWTFQKK